MKERVLDTGKGQFELLPWDGVNHSGIDPCCDKVLVRVDKSLDKTMGGVLLTQNSSENQTLASTTGIIIAAGPQAFLWDSDRMHKWEGHKPGPGHRCCFQKYAGQEYFGLDGVLYRVMQDRVIGATMGMAERVEPGEMPAADEAPAGVVFIGGVMSGPGVVTGRATMASEGAAA